MEYGIFMSGTFISGGVKESRDPDTGGKVTNRYVLLTIGGVEVNSVPRIKMTDGAWKSYIESGVNLGDDVVLKVRPFGVNNSIYYTADTFAVAGQ